MFKSDIGQYSNLPGMQVLRYQNRYLKYCMYQELQCYHSYEINQFSNSWIDYQGAKNQVRREEEIIQPQYVKSHRAASSDRNMANFC